MIRLLPALAVLALAAPAAAAAPDPITAEVREAEARLALARGDRAMALARLNEALAADPDRLEARRLRGGLRAQAGRLTEAEEDLGRVVEAAPQDLPARRLLASVFVGQRKYLWAARHYQAIVEAAPDDSGAALAYGYCLIHAGETEEAASVLRRVAGRGSPAERSQARLLLATLARAAGQPKEARKLLGGVRGDEATLADALRRDLFASEGRAKRGLNLAFTLGVGYDSNAVMDTLDLRSSGSEALLLRLAARARWHAFNWGRVGVGVAGSLSRTFAVNAWTEGSCASDFSLLVGQVAPYLSVRFATGKVDHEVEVAYRGRLITLDGDCQAGSSLFAFAESHGATASWVIRPSERTSTHVVLDAGYTAFHQAVRDQAATALEVGQSIFLMGKRLKLYPELHLRYEHARGPVWTQVAVRPGIALSALLPASVDLIGFLEVEVGHFPHSAGHRPWRLGDQTNRRDVAARLGIVLGRAFTRWLRADLAYRYRRNLSNALPYDYDRHTLEASLTAQLDWPRQKARRR